MCLAPSLTWIWIIIAWRNEDKQGKFFSLCYNDWEMRCLSLDHHDMGNLFWSMPGSITELCTYMLTRGIEVMVWTSEHCLGEEQACISGVCALLIYCKTSWAIKTLDMSWVQKIKWMQIATSNNLRYPLHDQWMPRRRHLIVSSSRPLKMLEPGAQWWVFMANNPQFSWPDFLSTTNL